MASSSVESAPRFTGHHPQLTTIHSIGMSQSQGSLDTRPPFTTVFKAGSNFCIVDLGKEKRFEAWRVKNAQKMKEANVKPKVYEFSRAPVAIRESPPMSADLAGQKQGQEEDEADGNGKKKKQDGRSRLRLPGSGKGSAVRKLSPIRTANFRSTTNNKTTSISTERKKKLIKTRQRQKPTKLSKLKNNESSSSNDNFDDEPDSGISSNKSSSSAGSAGNPENRRLQKREMLAARSRNRSKEPAAVGVSRNKTPSFAESRKKAEEKMIKSLIEEVVEHSLHEVEKEERYMTELSKMRTN